MWFNEWRFRVENKNSKLFCRRKPKAVKYPQFWKWEIWLTKKNLKEQNYTIACLNNTFYKLEKDFSSVPSFSLSNYNAVLSRIYKYSTNKNTLYIYLFTETKATVQMISVDHF